MFLQNVEIISAHVCRSFDVIRSFHHNEVIDHTS
jgi:hypothetical protein